MDNIKLIIDTSSKLHELIIKNWLAQELLSIKWWGIVAFIIISYVICFWLLDKKQLSRAILFGSLISVFSVVIDIVGTSFDLWIYLVHVFPITPAIFIYDITALPLYYMLIFQRVESWWKYIIWNIVVSVFMGFVFTPLMVKWGLLQLLNWNYLYAFLTIALIGFMGKAVVSLVLYIEKRYQLLH